MSYSILVWTIVALRVGREQSSFVTAIDYCSKNTDCQFEHGEICYGYGRRKTCRCNHKAHFRYNPDEWDRRYQDKMIDQGYKYIPRCVCKKGYKMLTENSVFKRKCCRDATIEHEYIFVGQAATLTCEAKEPQPAVSGYRWSGIQCNEKPSNKKTCTFMPTRNDTDKTVYCSVSQCYDYAPSIRLPVHWCKEGYKWSEEKGGEKCCRDATIEHEYMVVGRPTTLSCIPKVAEPPVSSYTWTGVECEEDPSTEQNCTFTPDNKLTFRRVLCNISDCVNYAPSLLLDVHSCPEGYRWSMEKSGEKCCRDAEVRIHMGRRRMFAYYMTRVQCILKVPDPDFTDYKWSGVQCLEKPNNTMNCTFKPVYEDLWRSVKCSVSDCVHNVPSLQMPVQFPPFQVPKILGYNESYVAEGSSLTMNCTVEGGYPLVEVNFTCPGVPDSEDYKGSNYSTSKIQLKSITRSYHGKQCQCYGIWKGNTLSWSYDLSSAVRIFVLEKKSDPKVHASRTIEEDNRPYYYIAIILAVPGAAMVAFVARKFDDERTRAARAAQAETRPSDQPEIEEFVELAEVAPTVATSSAAAPVLKMKSQVDALPIGADRGPGPGRSESAMYDHDLEDSV